MAFDGIKRRTIATLVNPIIITLVFSFDIYRKVPKDLTQPTLAGAIISIGCVAFIAFLFCSELYAFLNVDVVSELYVDDPEKVGRISVSINVSLPHLNCDHVGLDIQDDMGRHEVGYLESTLKTPLEPLGNDGRPGCRFEAQFQVNKVPGNFHISTHSAQQQPENPNMQHIIHSVVFGQRLESVHGRGSFNPLQNRQQTTSDGINSHDYILKVVPSTYEQLNGVVTYGYQYTYAHREYTAYSHGGMAMPAIWFRYDLTPITVCAIIGGTFTVAGIIDSFFFSATEYYRKLEIGKLN